MRLDYADSSGCIVQSEYLNVILNQNLKNLCPECTLNMRTIVPNSSFRFHKEDFEIIWNALDPDGKTMRVDSLHGFEDLSITNTMKGMHTSRPMAVGKSIRVSMTYLKNWTIYPHR